MYYAPPEFVERLERRRLLSYTVSALAEFDGSDGQNPQAGLIADAAGNLYGTTPNGGSSSDGTVFEVTRGSGAITTLASFDSNRNDGTNPNSGLVVSTSGNLYGTTADGGANGEGTVFELAKGSSTATTLASFNETNGAGPIGALVMDAAGNLYGTAEAGGAYGVGTLFEVAKSSGTVTVLANFDGNNGASPTGGLIADAAGDLFGTTSSGGADNDGTVFELAKDSGTITVLASFDGTDGASPGNALVADAAGDLFGTASVGGAADDGTVFEVAKGSGVATALASFDGTDGSVPSSGLVLDTAGDLYGTASQGGAAGDGTVFEVASGSGAINALASFDGTNGANPNAALYMDAAGNLYGTTQAGGDANGDGTVFELSGSAPTPTPVSTPSPTPAPTPTPTPVPAGTLAVSVSAKIPAAVVGGAKANASAVVNVSNSGGAAISGPVTVTLYVSPAQSLDGATRLLAVTPKLNLKAGAHKALRLKMSSFPSVPAGTYYLIAAAKSATGSATSAAGPSLSISPPFVSIVASNVRPSPLSVTPGRKLSLALTLQDTGNQLASGTAMLTIAAAANPSGAGGTTVASIPLKVKLKPGAAKTDKLKFKVPADLPAGSYYLAATANVAALGDRSAADAFAVSGFAVTVT